MWQPGSGSQDVEAKIWKFRSGSWDLVARILKLRSGSENDGKGMVFIREVRFYRKITSCDFDLKTSGLKMLLCLQRAWWGDLHAAVKRSVESVDVYKTYARIIFPSASETTNLDTYFTGL